MKMLLSIFLMALSLISIAEDIHSKNISAHLKDNDTYSTVLEGDSCTIRLYKVNIDHLNGSYDQIIEFGFNYNKDEGHRLDEALNQEGHSIIGYKMNGIMKAERPYHINRKKKLVTYFHHKAPVTNNKTIKNILNESIVTDVQRLNVSLWITEENGVTKAEFFEDEWYTTRLIHTCENLKALRLGNE